MSDLIKKLLFDVVLKAALKKLFEKFPIIGWGVIGSIVTALINKFAEVTYDLGKELIVGGIISFKNEAHQNAFDKELIKLKLLERNGASEKEVEDAIKIAQERLADLVVHSSSL